MTNIVSYWPILYGITLCNHFPIIAITLPFGVWFWWSKKSGLVKSMSKSSLIINFLWLFLALCNSGSCFNSVKDKFSNSKLIDNSYSCWYCVKLNLVVPFTRCLSFAICHLSYVTCYLLLAIVACSLRLSILNLL